MCNIWKNYKEKKVEKIIKQLESYSPYEDKLYEELRMKLLSLPHNLENSFYFFFFCVDWRYLYDYAKRLTLYDIYFESGEKTFIKAYIPLKKMALQGDITDISRTYSDIIGTIKIGLQNVGIDKNDASKGLYEFMQHFFKKLVNVDYEITDYTSSYLSPDRVIERFSIDVFDKFILVYQFTSYFNNHKKNRIETDKLKISSSFLSHVLLRHYGPLKVFTNYHPNPAFHTKIKNGLGEMVPIAAFMDDGIYVISQDGVFENSKSSGNKAFLKEDIDHIIEITSKILPVLLNNIKPERSPNIVYYEGMLYGVEFPLYHYSATGVIRVESIYPLNSKWQSIHGLSQRDLEFIINPSDIPTGYEIKLESQHYIKKDRS